MDVKALLADMTIEEKVGQMVQVLSDALGAGGQITGPLGTVELGDDKIANVGSTLAIHGAAKLKQIQDEQMAKQPHHIPFCFMADVINGFQTIFPIPLAQGASFNPDMTEKCASIAAAEAAASGISVTFSPMLDLCRDARWGRVMESPGESVFLNGVLGAAMVRGYQGVNVNDGTTEAEHACKHGKIGKGKVAATIKHFAGYGRPEGGRDYDTVDISARTLADDYLPAYAAAVEAGARLVMTSFNTLDRVPSTGNKWLMRDVLRDKMRFEGVLISDYSAAEEMLNHGIAADFDQACKLAIETGLDIDMVSNCYVHHLADLVRAGKVDEKLVDEACLRVLQLKDDLGLFDNPYKDASEEDEKCLFMCAEHRKVSERAAEDSFVLLENDGILPLNCGAGYGAADDAPDGASCASGAGCESSENVAFIGPYSTSDQIYGTWSIPDDIHSCISIEQAVRDAGLAENAEFVQGSYVMDKGTFVRFGDEAVYDDAHAAQMLREAVETAKRADKVVMCLGEHSAQSGECASRANIRIPECQQHLLEEVYKVNKNVVVVLFCGRPLETQDIVANSRALLVVWFPGTEGGRAITNVLYNLDGAEPAGRLPMTFPKRAGQCPIYYDQLPTGRPNPSGTDKPFLNGYIDESTKPAYVFGYGKTYTTFEYGEVLLSCAKISEQDNLTASATVTNTGKCAAHETVQLYIHDVAASVSRPKKQLKDFNKIYLQPGESKKVEFEICADMLKFHDINMNYVTETGTFEVFIGSDSATKNVAEFQFV